MHLPHSADKKLWMLFGPSLFKAYLLTAAPNKTVKPDVITKQHEVYVSVCLCLLPHTKQKWGFIVPHHKFS